MSQSKYLRLSPHVRHKLRERGTLDMTSSLTPVLCLEHVGELLSQERQHRLPVPEQPSHPSQRPRKRPHLSDKDVPAEEKRRMDTLRATETRLKNFVGLQENLDGDGDFAMLTLYSALASISLLATLIASAAACTVEKAN